MILFDIRSLSIILYCQPGLDPGWLHAAFTRSAATHFHIAWAGPQDRRNQGWRTIGLMGLLSEVFRHPRDVDGARATIHALPSPAEDSRRANASGAARRRNRPGSPPVAQRRHRQDPAGTQPPAIGPYRRVRNRQEDERSATGPGGGSHRRSSLGIGTVYPWQPCEAAGGSYRHLRHVRRPDLSPPGEPHRRLSPPARHLIAVPRREEMDDVGEHRRWRRPAAALPVSFVPAAAVLFGHGISRRR